jgi:hypothetical protein
LKVPTLWNLSIIHPVQNVDALISLGARSYEVEHRTVDNKQAMIDLLIEREESSESATMMMVMTMITQRVSLRLAALEADFKSVILHYMNTEHSRHTNIRAHIFA